MSNDNFEKNRFLTDKMDWFMAKKWFFCLEFSRFLGVGMDPALSHTLAPFPFTLRKVLFCPTDSHARPSPLSCLCLRRGLMRAVAAVLLPSHKWRKEKWDTSGVQGYTTWMPILPGKRIRKYTGDRLVVTRSLSAFYRLVHVFFQNLWGIEVYKSDQLVHFIS